MSEVDFTQLSNLVDAIPDLALGDFSLGEKFSVADTQTIAEALRIIREDLGAVGSHATLETMANLWKVHYRVKPPSPEEFLTEAWIGPMSNSIFPFIRKIFLEYWAPTSPYRSLILGAAIGTGKSTVSVLSNLYVTIHLWCMRDPKKFFGLAASTSMVQALISFSQDKAAQLLLQPFMQIILSAPRFRRVKQEENLTKRQLEYPNEVCWTSAGKIGKMQFYNDIHYPIVSSPANILGLNMITATMSEISFFVERGFSPEYIWRIFQDSKARVQNRFGTRFLSTVILDSSPNDLEASPIDKFIFTGEAAKDPSNYIVTGPHWEFRPDHDIYKEWKKTRKTFPVFRGNASEPAAIVETAVHGYNPQEIIQVPIDLRRLFDENLIKNVKDWAGWPAGNPDKLIRDASFIEGIFKTQLRNFYSVVHVPSTENPNELIWNMVRPKFFIESSPGRYEFYRAPRAERFIHIDQAEKKDHAGITMSHLEWDDERQETVCVHDFTMDIAPSKVKIGLDAIRLFPEDLRNKGHITIKVISFDQYQSSLTREYLERKGFDCRLFSVDRDPKIYYSYIAWINTGRIKAGRNLAVKNNLKSLQEITRQDGTKKIDHTQGKISRNDDVNWDTSTIGMFGKDVTDSSSGSFYAAMMESKGVPRYVWSEAKEPRTEELLLGTVTQDDLIEKTKLAYLARLEKKFGLKIKTETVGTLG